MNMTLDREVVARFGAVASMLVCSSALACGQILAGPISGELDKGLWRLDIVTRDRVRVCDQGSSALAVDDSGGRVFFALGAQLLRWDYGGALNSSVALGTVVRPNGAELSIIGLAYGGGRLFASAYGAPWLFEVSLSSLVATPVATASQLESVEGLSFDASSGLFYAADSVPNGLGLAVDLYSIDLLGSGAMSLVAAIPFESDTVCVGNGIAYAMNKSGGRIISFDLAANTYGNELLAPWSDGLFACGSEFAPSLTPPAGPRVFCHTTAPQVCQPVLSSIGAPSASAASGFDVLHKNLYRGSTISGVYSLTGRSAAPFQGGLRCIAGPIFRIQPVVGPSTIWWCSNDHALDFNALIASGTNAGLVAGQTVWYQAVIKPGSVATPSTLQFTSGLEFTILP